MELYQGNRVEQLSHFKLPKKDNNNALNLLGFQSM